MLLGGTGAGAYYVGADERSFGSIIDDGAITSSLKTRMVADKYLGALDINIDTYQGRVTLTGHVSKSGYIQRASRLANSITGVRSVRNRLIVIKD